MPRMREHGEDGGGNGGERRRVVALSVTAKFSLVRGKEGDARLGLDQPGAQGREETLSPTRV